MNLPLILDITVGLVFTYLILSLLASEIQELLATVLQWRAKHLKTSIDIMLAGGSEVDTSERETAIKLANALYNNPLINTLNYEYKQTANSETFSPNQGKNKIKIFGRRKSGPSYIPSETFATTLIDTLKIPELIQRATEPRLTKLKDKQLDYIELLLKALKAEQDINEKLTIEFDELRADYEEIIQNFKNHQATLNASLKRMADQLDAYISIAEAVLPHSDAGIIFLSKIKSLRRDTFDIANNSLLLGGLQPSLAEVLEDLKQLREYSKQTRQQIPNSDSAVYQRLQEVYGDVTDIVDTKVLEHIPDSVINSLSVLATRTQAKIDNVEGRLSHFQKEVETWFDRSMDRASGVYKRNAKGVALLIGLLVALFTNTDTFHVVTRLSKDSELRNIITSRASQVSPDNNLVNLREDIRDIERQLLEEVSLPIGWSPANVAQQYDEEWTISGRYIPFLKRFFGWILTAMAIAMGAPFWFDLLNRVVNVRNTGPKPVSYTNDRPPSS
jgi:hypothetical protein